MSNFLDELSIQRIKELLHYNPETGVFTWIKSNTNVVKSGTIAGTCSSGYILIQVDNKFYKAHRLAWLYMTGLFPKFEIDHINHIRNDNRWENLREVSTVENMRNRSLQNNNKTGLPGVHFLKDRAKWISYIELNGIRKYLCRTIDFFEACCARKSAEIYYGFHPNHGKTKELIK